MTRLRIKALRERLALWVAPWLRKPVTLTRVWVEDGAVRWGTNTTTDYSVKTEAK